MKVKFVKYFPIFPSGPMPEVCAWSTFPISLRKHQNLKRGGEQNSACVYLEFTMHRNCLNTKAWQVVCPIRQDLTCVVKKRDFWWTEEEELTIESGYYQIWGARMCYLHQCNAMQCCRYSYQSKPMHTCINACNAIQWDINVAFMQFALPWRDIISR